MVWSKDARVKMEIWKMRCSENTGFHTGCTSFFKAGRRTPGFFFETSTTIEVNGGCRRISFLGAMQIETLKANSAVETHAFDFPPIP